MLTKEQRTVAGALWLSRWQACAASGLSVAAYGRQEGFDARAAYRWKRALRRIPRIASRNFVTECLTQDVTDSAQFGCARQYFIDFEPSAV